MGYVPSTPTITLQAYLTQKGREYFINGTEEQINILYFGLSDNDTNYYISTNIVGGDNNTLPSGFVPDISGDHLDCIRSIYVFKQKNLLSNPIDNTDKFITINNI